MNEDQALLSGTLMELVKGATVSKCNTEGSLGPLSLMAWEEGRGGGGGRERGPHCLLTGYIGTT